MVYRVTGFTGFTGFTRFTGFTGFTGFTAQLHRGGTWTQPGLNVATEALQLH
jgi:hypothetical protein